MAPTRRGSGRSKMCANQRSLALLGVITRAVASCPRARGAAPRESVASDRRRARSSSRRCRFRRFRSCLLRHRTVHRCRLRLRASIRSRAEWRAVLERSQIRLLRDRRRKSRTIERRRLEIRHGVAVADSASDESNDVRGQHVVGVAAAWCERRHAVGSHPSLRARQRGLRKSEPDDGKCKSATKHVR